MVLKFKTDPARTAAIEARSTRYEGRPCIHCQGTERYVSSGGCVRCAAERATRSYVGAGAYKPKPDSARGVAFVQGVTTYQGGACQNCTSTERYTSSGGCVHCTKTAIKDDGRTRRKYEKRRVAGLNVPPKPEDGKCECCETVAPLMMDHDHALIDLGYDLDEAFRGWLCNNCNVGLARLGDNQAGAQKAVAYHERAQARFLQRTTK